MKRILVSSTPFGCENYAAAVRLAGAEPVVSEEWVKGCEGLLLTGGQDIDPTLYGCENTSSWAVDVRRDANELALLRRALTLGLPVFGICRGHQLLNAAFGGTLCQHIEGHDQVQKKDRLHAAACEGRMAALYGKECTVNSSHHQCVDRIGTGLIAEQWSAEGIVEALRHETLPVFSVQWHPERLMGAFERADAVNGRLIFEEFLKLTEKVRS